MDIWIRSPKKIHMEFDLYCKGREHLHQKEHLYPQELIWN